MNEHRPDRFRILVVDDEPLLLGFYQDVLCPEEEESISQSGLDDLEARLFSNAPRASAVPKFDLKLCPQGDAAVEIVREALQEKDPFSVIFLDVRMPPGPDGVWTAENIRALDPDAQVVIVTAYSDIDPAEIAQRVPPSDKLLYVQKPFQPAELRQFAVALSAKWRAEKQLVGAYGELETKVEERTAELARMNEQLERDIAERKMLQQQLVQAQKMESIGTLAGGVAHDFNNLLGAILGYSSLMRTKISESHPFYNYISTIERSATRAADLTGQLLAFARGGKYEMKPININDIVIETLGIMTRTFDKSIEIEQRLGPLIPTVEGDTTQIAQVILNLCVNARDAMPDGGKLLVETELVRLTDEYTKAHLEAKPGPYVALSVSDTGVGMDKATMQRIFEPFFTTKEEGKGTGLGLSMVYGVVKNHGGIVHVYSEPGEGAAFRIYLPANGKPETGKSLKRRAPLEGNELILVIDDEEPLRSLARDVLESHGYRVIVAENGAEGADLYGKRMGEIDLVIVDMIMPKMGGRETFFKVRGLNPNAKVLLSTGYSQNGKAREILDSGAMGFVQKPYQVDTLLLAVRDALDGTE
ncbi:response regulator [Candidatus Poribacteria bacterium]|nr:response regulator [Candidatus Poribacteria bacterium]